MDTKFGIDDQVNDALHGAGKVGRVESPPFFTDRTMQKIKSSEKESNRTFYGSILKIAAIIVLAMVNLYTIYYIAGNSKKESQIVQQATLKDFINEYQPTDSTVVTIENNLNNE